MHQCNTCHKAKGRRAFYPCKTTTSGITHKCRACVKSCTRAWRRARKGGG